MFGGGVQLGAVEFEHGAKQVVGPLPLVAQGESATRRMSSYVPDGWLTAQQFVGVFPQHSILPLVWTPQAQMLPTSTFVNAPEGAEASHWYSADEGQQLRASPASEMAHAPALPIRTTVKFPVGAPLARAPQHPSVPSVLTPQPLPLSTSTEA